MSALGGAPQAGVGPGAAAGMRVDVRPAPVQELAYAFFRVASPENPSVSANLPWLRRLEASPPDWFAAARSAFTDGGSWTGFEPLLMACALGYALDDSPARFLEDLAGLPSVMVRDLDELNIGGHDKPPATSTPSGRLRARLRANYEALAAPERAAALQRTLTELWACLEPDWQREGRSATAQAAERLVDEAAATGDLLAALPPHHFVSLESSVNEIRLRQQQVRLVVAPLYFASLGGFKFEIGRTLYLGFGVRSERLFLQRKEQVQALAARLKAFADPTRLLLLVLVSRLRRFPLTVGDLARQLGVSQPTASGHLKLLRDLDLVEVVKRGNRSYYRIREGSLTAILRELEDTLILRSPTPDDDN